MSENQSTGSSKVYTRTGDKGKTSLIGGTRVSKSDLRLETYGTIDELNSVVGVVIANMKSDLGSGFGSTIGTDFASGEAKAELVKLTAFLQRTQSDLFDIGSHLACEDEALRAKLPLVHEDHISELEAEMDRFSSALPALKNFILPGGTKAAAHAHVARTVCRRAERLCVALGDQSSVEAVIIRYINRLSDYLFVLARHLNRLTGTDEILWSPRTKA
jgi:cob(I)alamin adenosyltransferase